MVNTLLLKEYPCVIMMLCVVLLQNERKLKIETTNVTFYLRLSFQSDMLHARVCARIDQIEHRTTDAFFELRKSQLTLSPQPRQARGSRDPKSSTNQQDRFNSRRPRTKFTYASLFTLTVGRVEKSVALLFHCLLPPHKPKSIP